MLLFLSDSAFRFLSFLSLEVSLGICNNLDCKGANKVRITIKRRSNKDHSGEKGTVQPADDPTMTGASDEVAH